MNAYSLTTELVISDVVVDVFTINPNVEFSCVASVLSPQESVPSTCMHTATD